MVQEGAIKIVYQIHQNYLLLNESKEFGKQKILYLGGARNYISGFEGSQAVPARPSRRGNAYVRN
jgi:hypothetical protein